MLDFRSLNFGVLGFRGFKFWGVGSPSLHLNPEAGIERFNAHG